VKFHKFNYNDLFNIKGPIQCFSMQVIMNKCFLLNPDKKFGADPSCRTPIPKKWCYWAKG